MPNLPKYTDTRTTDRRRSPSGTQRVTYLTAPWLDSYHVHYGIRKKAGFNKTVTSVRGRKVDLDIVQNPFFLHHATCTNHHHSWTTGELDPNRIEVRDGELLGLVFDLAAEPPYIDIAAADLSRLGVINKVLAKAKGPEFASVTQLGEARETLRSIRNGLIAIAGAKVALPKKWKGFKRKSMLKRVKAAFKKTTSIGANLHLGFVFGYAPCAAAVSDLQSLLSKQIEVVYGAMSVYSGATIADSDTTESYNYVPNDSATFGINYDMRTVDVRKVSASLRIKTHPESQKTDWGNDWYDVILASWELTRYSFLLDWLLDVSNWLGAMRPTTHELLSLSTTGVSNQTYDLTATRIWKRWEPNQYATCESSLPEGYGLRMRNDVVRRVVHELEATSIPVLNPSMLKLGQWMILCSLLATRIGSHGIGMRKPELTHVFDLSAGVWSY